ncbi:MAG: hypothetical protein H8D67_04725, partial [Deltaproteobacteria bacterium]|nr:hypothetical protein [Deltaproteobacteria bacterium]
MLQKKYLIPISLMFFISIAPGASSSAMPIINVSDSAEDSISPSVAVGPDDSLHIVWKEGDNKIYYRRISSEGDFIDEPREIYFDGRLPQIAVDSQNNAHICCQGPF